MHDHAGCCCALCLQHPSAKPHLTTASIYDLTQQLQWHQLGCLHFPSLRKGWLRKISLAVSRHHRLAGVGPGNTLCHLLQAGPAGNGAGVENAYSFTGCKTPLVTVCCLRKRLSDVSMSLSYQGT
jgi:hypothetical protein